MFLTSQVYKNITKTEEKLERFGKVFFHDIRKSGQRGLVVMLSNYAG